MKNEKITTDNQGKGSWSSRLSKKARVSSAFGAAGIFMMTAFAVAPTGANWIDEEAVGSEISAGNFDLEVSVNGGAWQSGTGTGNSAVISFNDFDYWAPGDSQSREFSIRNSPNSSHDARIDLSSCGTGAGNDVRVQTSGQPAGYSWSMGTWTPSHWTFGSNSLSDCGDGSSMEGASGVKTISPGESIDFNVTLSANSSLSQSSETDVSWTFTGESVPNT